MFQVLIPRMENLKWCHYWSHWSPSSDWNEYNIKSQTLKCSFTLPYSDWNSHPKVKLWRLKTQDSRLPQNTQCPMSHWNLEVHEDHVSTSLPIKCNINGLPKQFINEHNQPLPTDRLGVLDGLMMSLMRSWRNILETSLQAFKCLHSIHCLVKWKSRSQTLKAERQCYGQHLIFIVHRIVLQLHVEQIWVAQPCSTKPPNAVQIYHLSIKNQISFILASIIMCNTCFPINV